MYTRMTTYTGDYPSTAQFTQGNFTNLPDLPDFSDLFHHPGSTGKTNSVAHRHIQHSVNYARESAMRTNGRNPSLATTELAIPEQQPQTEEQAALSPLPSLSSGSSSPSEMVLQARRRIPEFENMRGDWKRKQEERRLKNRIAAKKCREKAKKRLRQLEEENKKLKSFLYRTAQLSNEMLGPDNCPREAHLTVEVHLKKLLFRCEVLGVADPSECEAIRKVLSLFQSVQEDSQNLL